MQNTIIQGDCLNVLPTLQRESVNLILTDPPYLVNFKARDGRTVPNDDNDLWLKPAFAEMYRVLAPGSFCVSFYGWPSADKFLQAYRAAGFRVAGHFVFPKRYTSKTRFVRYQHECAHLLVKGNPWVREDTIGDVVDWTYSGNKLHPTQKPISVLTQLIEAFSALATWCSTPSPEAGPPCTQRGCLGANGSASRWISDITKSPVTGSGSRCMVRT